MLGPAQQGKQDKQDLWLRHWIYACLIIEIERGCSWVKCSMCLYYSSNEHVPLLLFKRACASITLQMRVLKSKNL